MPKGGLWDVDGFPSAMVDGHFTHHGQVGFSYIPITYILSTVLSFAKDPLSRCFMTGPVNLVATFCVLWYKDRVFFRYIWLKMPKLETDIIYRYLFTLSRQLHVRWKAKILNSSLFWMTPPFGGMALTQLPYTLSILKHIDMHRFQLSQAGVSTSDSLSWTLLLIATFGLVPLTFFERV